MGLLKKKQDEEFVFETTDLLIVFDDDNKTSDIQRITDIADNAVMVAGTYKVPLPDCEISTGKDGRNFFYRAPAQSITETERLARLEQNMVLNQITAYRPPILPTGMDWTKGILFFLIFIAFVVMAFVAT